MSSSLKIGLRLHERTPKEEP
ncbi:hypothetical protein FQN60_008597 [Etheostoma spectabile]|uniref:Uncharacterized protein n=1 Tax=Etheostoma spectabile TaxID=54343 RepID=A0A5J5CJK0_9PERO|nr:hypothetical protein FQN60_008597 [Etheostoma spectabile]